jgi:hypothetical protein
MPCANHGITLLNGSSRPLTAGERADGTAPRQVPLTTRRALSTAACVIGPLHRRRATRRGSARHEQRRTTATRAQRLGEIVQHVRKPPSSMKNCSPCSAPSRKSSAQVIVGPRVGEIARPGVHRRR